ncbi:MAG: putative AAA-ATPase [Gammaproteobacteria bacterium]|jgi:hypothetical protein|nr:putative AAA-ATPase [Gammaproteobacteria bacterium]
MSLMIGLDNFGEAVSSQIGFVDKSLFIKEILDNKIAHVSVITRPRRFGKTFNMSMLHHFLADKVGQLETKQLFNHLEIARIDGGAYMEHQGKYPIIFISFKNVDATHFDEACEQLWYLISTVYREHRYLRGSTKLDDSDKKTYEQILDRKIDSKSALKVALQELCRFLHLHHGKKPWLLIDEYDTPIQAGYLNNHYGDIIDLMRGIFGSVLKGNADLHRAVITGILRISKESLFSGVNNLKIYSLLNAEYATCFGFTQSEVDQVFKKANLEHLASNVKAWYNGYSIGDHQIYNPWSIANCLYAKGETAPYWVGTSSNDLIKKTMALASPEIKEKFELLLAGESIEAVITENMTFSDLTTNGNALWNLLLFSGYLTIVAKQAVNMRFDCSLKTPNHEVDALYRDVICQWFENPFGIEVYRNFLKNLTEGDVDKFISILRRFLKESTSCFDVKGHYPEKFYHGFVLGLIVGLSETHIVESNKESGEGRYDVSITPKDLTKLGLIIEFKVAEENVILEKSAEQALAQINARDYETALRQKGVQRILKLGLAFRDKEVSMAFGMSE